MSDDRAKSNREFIERLYKTGGEQDWEAVLAMFDEDVVLYESEALPYAGTYRGLEEVSNVFGQLAQAMDMSTIELEYVVADEERAVAHVRVQLNGDIGETRFSEHWKIRDGKAVEIRPFYWDPGAITRSAQLASTA